MIHKLDMNEEQAALLIRILTNKAKEIHRRQEVLDSDGREKEYYSVTANKRMNNV